MPQDRPRARQAVCHVCDADPNVINLLYADLKALYRHVWKAHGRTRAK